MEIDENLKKRIITASIAAPIVLLVIYIGGWFYTLTLTCLAVLMAYEWHHMTESKNLKWLAFGVIYISIPISAMMWLRHIEEGMVIVFWIVILVWATDIGAYIAGKTIGGAKLAPSISPNKTWAGLTGGIIFAMVIGLIFGIFAHSSFITITLISGLLAIIEQIGDLAESKIKRLLDIKDTGNILPGHGGILDRVDGFTIVAPIVALLITLFGDRLFSW